MATTQVPPDIRGTFYDYYREVETHDWYARLSSATRDALHEIYVWTDGWGSCRCGRGGRLYGFDHAGTNIGTKRCSNCVRRMLVSEVASVYDVYRNVEHMDTIMPEAHFPKHENTRTECEKCCGYIYEADDHNVSMSSSMYVDAYKDDGTRQNVVRVHKTCAFRCECDSYFHANYPTHLNNRAICNECYERIESDTDIYECNHCSQNFTELHYSEVRDQELCDECYNREIECDCGYFYQEGDWHECYRDSSGIYTYSYKPDPVFYGQDDYHFGFELEVEDDGGFGCGAGANLVSDLLGQRVYMKSDGSLDCGFEIVSHPHSLEEIQRLDWGFLRELRTRGFRSWDTSTCGLHVHVSRTAFRKDGKRDEGHELRFQKLVYDNKAQVQAIAGRESSFANFNDKGKLVRKVKYGQSSDRYEAINSQNSHTLEVRVFRGSLKKERVLSAIEFVHSAVEYTRNMKINPHDKQFSWIRFMAYVLDNQTKYPNFTQIALRTLDNQSSRSSHIDEENN